MVPNRIIAFLIYNMKHKNIFSKRKSAVLFFTIAFLAMGGYCVATKAQTTQIASTLEKLKGQEVTKENYTQFVTNGEKPSSMKDALFNGQAKNMFLLYNKGTGDSNPLALPRAELGRTTVQGISINPYTL